MEVFVIFYIKRCNGTTLQHYFIAAWFNVLDIQKKSEPIPERDVSSDFSVVVELSGFEPLTSALRTQRSTN